MLMNKRIDKGKMAQNLLDAFDGQRYIYTQEEIQENFGEDIYQSIIGTPEF